MKRMVLLGLVGTGLLAPAAFAQDSAVTPPNPAASQTSAPPSAQKANPSATPTTTGAPKTNRGKSTEKQKAYTGNEGRKRDPGTACNSARPNPNGGVDCGMSGNAATPGKVPK
jgi:hypothetical protein